MEEVHYGVVRQNGAWTIIGASLRFGSYKTGLVAERAARRLASKSSGLPVQLHVQDDTGELQSPERLDPEEAVVEEHTRPLLKPNLLDRLVRAKDRCLRELAKRRPDGKYYFRSLRAFLEADKALQKAIGRQIAGDSSVDPRLP